MPVYCSQSCKKKKWQAMKKQLPDLQFFGGVMKYARWQHCSSFYFS